MRATIRFFAKLPPGAHVQGIHKHVAGRPAKEGCAAIALLVLLITTYMCIRERGGASIAKGTSGIMLCAIAIVIAYCRLRVAAPIRCRARISCLDPPQRS